jgi:outer membrane protein assembly factor BamB
MRSRHWATLCVLASFFVSTWATAEDWPQWRGTNRDGQWRETGIVDRFEGPRIELRWRKPLGSGYSGPTVADGYVYVMDRALEPRQLERVHCFDWKSGVKLWTHSYDCEYRNIGYSAGPRASVTVEDGRAFALGAMGHLHCLDAGTGAVLWRRDLNRDYQVTASGRMPMWGIASSPLVFENLVILQIGGDEGACLVALEKKSGEEVWRALRDRAQYSAPVLIEQAGQPVVVCWTGDSVAGMDPLTGDVFWRHPFAPTRMPIGVATPVVEGNRLFVSSFYDGSLMLELMQDRTDVRPIWRRRGRTEKDTDSLHCMISTPVLQGDYVFGVDSYGELRCLDARTGDRIWEDQTATPRARWSNIHFVKQGDRYWMFNERGDLLIGRLSPEGFQELSRAHLIDPTLGQLRQRNGVCWSHPAFAEGHVFARNDVELVCASLEAD